MKQPVNDFAQSIKRVNRKLVEILSFENKPFQLFNFYRNKHFQLRAFLI